MPKSRGISLLGLSLMKKLLTHFKPNGGSASVWRSPHHFQALVVLTHTGISAFKSQADGGTWLRRAGGVEFATHVTPSNRFQTLKYSFKELC